jgi:hypothetical protein
VSTSRKPSKKTILLAKDLSKSFPNSFYIARGKKSIDKLVELALFEGKRMILIVKEKEGNPIQIDSICVTENSWNYGLTLLIKVLRLRKELTNFKAAFKTLSLNVSNEKLKCFLEKLGIVFESDSENVLIEKKNVISFYRFEKEIGPRIKIEAIT